MKKHFTILSISGLLVLFQNCSERSFSPDSTMYQSLDGSEQLVIDDGPQENPDNINDEMTTEADDEDQSPPKYNPEIPRDKDKDKYTDKYVKEDDDKKNSCDGHDEDAKNDSDRYLCVLEGSGKSQHVALMKGALTSDNSTPQAVCISRRACEEIVGAKLDVKSVEQRGFCKNGAAHTVALSDLQVKDLVDRLK